MEGPIPGPDVPSETARALLGASPLPSRGCPACGAPLTGRQRACSGKCRAEKSRRLRSAASRERDERIGKLLGEALTLLKREG